MADSAVPHMSASARLVAGALAEVLETTVVGLADAAAVSKSTVAKTLSLLEDSGAAKRTVRETDGIREADLWSPTSGLAPLLAAATQDKTLKVSASAVPSVAEGATEADALGRAHDASGEASAMTAHDVGAATDVCWPKAGWAQSQTYNRVAETRLPNAALEAGEGSAATGDGPACQYASAATGGGTPRLAPGGLADLVAAALAAHPDIEYTATMLSHLLNGRSSGAIANVLAKMHTAGTAVRTCDKPKRYRHRDDRDAGAL